MQCLTMTPSMCIYFWITWVVVRGGVRSWNFTHFTSIQSPHASHQFIITPNTAHPCKSTSPWLIRRATDWRARARARATQLWQKYESFKYLHDCNIFGIRESTIKWHEYNTAQITHKSGSRLYKQPIRIIGNHLIIKREWENSLRNGLQKVREMA